MQRQWDEYKIIFPHCQPKLNMRETLITFVCVYIYYIHICFPFSLLTHWAIVKSEASLNPSFIIFLFCSFCVFGGPIIWLFRSCFQKSLKWISIGYSFLFRSHDTLDQKVTLDSSPVSTLGSAMFSNTDHKFK